MKKKNVLLWVLTLVAMILIQETVATFADPNDITAPVVTYRQIDTNTLERTETITYDKRVLQDMRSKIIAERDAMITRINNKYQPQIDSIDAKLAEFN